MSLGSTLRRLLTPARRHDGPAASEAELRAQLARYGPWTYPFRLPFEIETPVHVDWLRDVHDTRMRMIFPRLEELYGDRWDRTSCLDIACNEGFFALEARRRGARPVVGFDARPINVEKAAFVQRQLGYDGVEFHVEDISNLTPSRFGTFDVTLCLGLLYHLENPMDALRRIRAVTRELCVIDTQVLRDGPPVTAAWITDERLIETADTIGVIEEADATWNPVASVTGMSLVLSRSALRTMLRHAGFREIEELRPSDGCFPPFATGDRVIVLARPAPAT